MSDFLTTAVPTRTVEPAPSVRPIVRAADLGGTFLFAVEGALAGAQAHFDPVGILTLAFVVALGGEVARDTLLGLRAAFTFAWRLSPPVP